MVDMRVSINEETLQDIINIETGLLYPLDGFMREQDYRFVVESCTMADGQVFTIPVTLDIPQEIYDEVSGGEVIQLSFGNEDVAQILVESKFVMTDADIEKVFCTLDESHPGVRKERERSIYRIGGKTTLLKKELLQDALKPEETRQIFISI